MFLHLGQNVLVLLNDVVGIFDIENSSIAKSTRSYLAAAEKNKKVINVSTEMPKSFIVCKTKNRETVYVSQISSQTLKKRAGFIDGISL